MRLHGINHIATLTIDMDRLMRFYVDVFDAEILGDITDDEARHTFISLGPDTFLHPYEIAGNTQATQPSVMFARGRIDHLALNAATRSDFDEGIRRLVANGASDGVITDFGSMLSVYFRDPDGMECELCWNKHRT